MSVITKAKMPFFGDARGMAVSRHKYATLGVALIVGHSDAADAKQKKCEKDFHEALSDTAIP
jgi:hypothetical protein